MTISIISTLTILALFCISALLQRNAQMRSLQASHRCAKLLEGVLTLIQLAQKHRGLGAQQSGTATMQREQIAHELDNQWRIWSQEIPAIEGLQLLWGGLKKQPADFAGHCRLIDSLLGQISLLERRISETQKNAGEGIADRCREVEDLARLRGLSSRAANHAHCPIELEVPLRYLCQRLAPGNSQRYDASMQMALAEITQHLLDAQHNSITAARCFELLTPVIDNALDEVRKSIRYLRSGSSVSVDLIPS